MDALDRRSRGEPPVASGTISLPALHSGLAGRQVWLHHAWSLGPTDWAGTPRERGQEVEMEWLRCSEVRVLLFQAADLQGVAPCLQAVHDRCEATSSTSALAVQVLARTKQQLLTTNPDVWRSELRRGRSSPDIQHVSFVDLSDDGTAATQALCVAVSIACRTPWMGVSPPNALLMRRGVEHRRTWMIRFA
jgi:hypothetical protein